MVSPRLAKLAPIEYSSVSITWATIRSTPRVCSSAFPFKSSMIFFMESAIPAWYTSMEAEFSRSDTGWGRTH